MKIAFSALIICCLVTSSSSANNLSDPFIDTTIVTHLLDGNIAEWPAEKFVMDKATKMEYAVDNDNQTLFLAITISDKRIQKKVLQEGMDLYIDIKGKKKENRGIEFPAKTETIASIENMKLFGFNDGEPLLLSTKNEGGVNIAIAWDSSYVVHIEYNIPLKILDETVSSLNNKKVSIGWKLKESEMPGITNATTSQGGTVTRQLVAVPAGTRPSNSRTPNLNSNPVSSQTSPGPNKAQSIWTSHTIIF